MKNTKLLFAIGQGALVIAFAINKFFAKNMLVVIVLGVFTIISITANIIFLVNFGRERKARNRRDED